jgi:5-methylcytosine-specific restriction endonuclease McrA
MSDLSSAELAASTSDLSGPGCESSSNARPTPTADESLPDTGPESPALRTCERSQPRSYNWRLTEEEKRQATARYERGESCGAIAKDYGVSRQSMWDVLRRRTQMRDRIAALPRVEDRSKIQAKRKAALERYRSRAERITAAQIRTVRERDKVCLICGDQGTDIDHIKPVRAGGQTTLENLQLLCEPCHIDKSRQDWQRHPRKEVS